MLSLIILIHGRIMNGTIIPCRFSSRIRSQLFSGNCRSLEAFFAEFFLIRRFLSHLLPFKGYFIAFLLLTIIAYVREAHFLTFALFPSIALPISFNFLLSTKLFLCSGDRGDLTMKNHRISFSIKNENIKNLFFFLFCSKIFIYHYFTII